MFRLSTRTARYTQSMAYFSLLPILPLLPIPLAYRAARGVGRLIFALDTTRRNWSTAALAARLGIDDAEADQIARRSFELMCCDDLEGWLVPRLSKESVAGLIRFEGLDHLEAALAQGTGAVLYFGHVWGSRLCTVGLALLGYRVVVVRRRGGHGKDDPVRRWLFQRYRKTFEDKLGGRILTSVEQDGSTALGPLCVNALRKNEIIVLKPDVLSLRKTRAGDLDVSFLNGEQRFRPGGALIARAAGAPLLSVSIHRPLDFLPTRCVIGPPVEVAGDIRAVVEAQATRMEAEVRQDPACWSAWLVRSAWDLPQARLAQRVS